MPMKPHKGESQSDCMKRCMSETFTGDREQEQAVAICMNYWRGDKGGEKPEAKQCEPDPDESRADFMARCVDEGEDPEDCALYWSESKSNGAVIHKTHTGEVNGLEFILSDDSVDRMGDVVSASGWELSNFKKNPIALFSHRADFVIGTWRNLRVEGNELRGHLQLAPEGTSARIDEIRKLVEAGILRAVSVGFRPIESMPRKAAPGQMFPGEVYSKQ